MSAADNHKARSSHSSGKKRYTMAPKQSPMISLSTTRKKRPKRISSLFFGNRGGK